MSDRRLQVFHTVAKLLSFTKAAKVLHMTQPAVTFQIRQLEEQFDTRLFDRAHNRVTLTDAGLRAFDFSENIFEQYIEMENAIREITGDISGSLVIGASTTVADYMLPALLGDFKRKNPEVNMRLQVSNTEGIVSMVESNAIDLGVVEGPVNNKHLKVEVCRKDQLVAIVSPNHKLAKRKKVSLVDVMKCAFLCREEGSGTREVISAKLKAAGLDRQSVKNALELGSPEAVKGAVEADMGVSILSSVSVAKEVKLGTLVAIPLSPKITRNFSFVRQSHKFRAPAMEELLDFARAYCKESMK